MILRKYLIWLRKQFNTNFRNYLIIAISGFVLTSAIGFVVDILFEFGGWATFLRSAVLVPISIFGFSLAYAIGLMAHNYRVSSNPEWVPLRLRYSPRWRRRFAIIAAVIGLVFIYGFSSQIGYTFVSSMYVVLLIALFAFIRTTKDESTREEYNIPDPRDSVYDKKVQERQTVRAKAEERKKERKLERKEERFGVKKTSD